MNGQSRLFAGTLLGRLLLAATIASLCPSQARSSGPASPWPTFQHDNLRSGLSSVNTAANTGTLKWEFQPTEGDRTSVERSPVIAADGTIYMADEDHNLYALNPDGTLKWLFGAGGGTNQAPPAIGADGTIYLGVGDGNLYAINPSGTLKWKFPAQVSFAPAVAKDGTIYGDDGSFLYAVNPDGTLKWKAGGVAGTPAIGLDGTIYITGSSALYAINPDGSTKWSAPLPSPTSIRSTTTEAIGPDGTIYLNLTTSAQATCPDGAGALAAVSSGGALQWTFPTSCLMLNSPAVGDDGTVYIYSSDNNIYALNPDGTQKWKFPTNSGSESSPVIGADGTIYVGNGAGTIYALNADGSLKWQFATTGEVDSSPAIGADGTIYVGAGGFYSGFVGGLYALSSPAAGLHSISSITPVSGGNAGRVTITAIGTGFASGATASLSTASSEIKGASVEASADGTKLSATFDLSKQLPGVRDFVITNPDNTTATLPGAFTIQSGGAFNVDFKLFGPAHLRAGEGRTYYASASNTGNIDAPGFFGFVTIPAPIQVNSSLPILVESDGTQKLVVTCAEDELAPSLFCNVPFRLNVPDIPAYAHRPFALGAEGMVTDVSPQLGDPTANVAAAIMTASASALNMSLQVSDSSGRGQVSVSGTLGGNLGPAFPQIKLVDAGGHTNLTYDANVDLVPDAEVNADINASDKVLEKLEKVNDAYGKVKDGLEARKGYQEAKHQVHTLGELCTLCDLSSADDCMTMLNLGHGNAFVSLASPFVPEEAGPWWDAFSKVAAGAADHLLAKTYNDEPDADLPLRKCLAPYIAQDCNCDVDDKECSGKVLQPSQSQVLEAAEKVVKDYDIFNLKPSLDSCQKVNEAEKLSKPLAHAIRWYPRLGLFLQSVVAGDPNDKSGPPGAGAARWVPANQPLNYQIFFSNEPNASAAAQTVTITDQLDPTKVDFTTLALGPISFGSHTLTPPPGATNYSTVVDLRPTQTLAVNINASFDPSTGVLTWSYTSIDPTTGNPPADSTVGFLPPDNDPPNGEGNVLFSVMPIGNLATGTQIANQATVVFDVNQPINTAVWTNTIAQTSDSRLKASPRHLHFSNQKIGTTSAVQVVKIFNAGNGGGYGQGLTIEGFTATGDFVTGKSDCPQPPKTLTAGDSCSVQVAFAPGSPGRREGSLFAFSNAINGPRTVVLAGVNKQARLKMEPAELDFGPVAVGRSSNPLPVMLTDAGSEPLNLTDIAAVGDFTQTNDCGASLAPGKSCTASVIFSPTKEGRRHGFIIISDDAFNSPQRLKLIGKGR